MRWVICKKSYGQFTEGLKYQVYHESESNDCDEQKFYFIQLDQTKICISNSDLQDLFTSQTEWRDHQIKKIIP